MVVQYYISDLWNKSKELKLRYYSVDEKITGMHTLELIQVAQGVLIT